MVKNLPAMQETLVQCLGREIPQRTEWQPTPVFLPGEFHGQRSLAGYSPWGHKESDTTEQLTHTHTHRDNLKGFPDGSAGEESTCQCRSWGFDPCSMFPLQEGAQVRCLVWELTPHTLCSEVRKTKQKHILERGNGGMHVLTISTRTYPRSENESEEKLSSWWSDLVLKIPRGEPSLQKYVHGQHFGQQMFYQGYCTMRPALAYLFLSAFILLWGCSTIRPPIWYLY